MYNSMLRIIDELSELSDDEFNSTTIVEPEFRIDCNELIKSSYSSIDYQIDAFLIKMQQKYITNPILVRYQLEKIFVKQLEEENNIKLYGDIISVIESFLPTAPNMDNVHFVQTNYYLNKQIDGSDILRTSRSKKEKYFLWNRDNLLNYYNNYDDNNNNLDENNKSKIVINYEQENHLTYDFGDFSQINAIMIKTNSKGLGKHMIKVKIPNIHLNHDNDINNEWLTHSILSIASYDGWLGFVDLNILSQLIRLEFDANGAVINELLFV